MPSNLLNRFDGIAVFRIPHFDDAIATSGVDGVRIDTDVRTHYRSFVAYRVNKVKSRPSCTAVLNLNINEVSKEKENAKRKYIYYTSS